MDLETIIVIDSSKTGVSFTVDTSHLSGPLGTLVATNRRYVLYLIGHAPRAPWDSVDMHGSRATIKQRFLAGLAADTSSIATLAETAERLRLTARTTIGSAPSLRSATRTVTFQRLQDVAARFFYPDAVLRSGEIEAHVCVDINGILDMQGGRDPAVEAFAFAAIFHDIVDPIFFVDGDFKEAGRLINAMDLSSDAHTRLLRAQGVMWSLMVRSEKLRQVLLAGYERDHAYLPFQVSGWPSSRGDAARR